MPSEQVAVLRLADIDTVELDQLLRLYELTFHICPDNEPIPGSYWGGAEAGLNAAGLHARSDTPLHSILHETCHFICMDRARRQILDTDAGSDDDEENAVCYLQILLADILRSLGRERMFADMDAWGYSFRLGSSRAWFEQDAVEARSWLRQRGLIDAQQQPTLKPTFCRTA